MLISQLLGIKGSEKIDYDELAKLTEGYSGADVIAVTQEAKMELVRQRLKGKTIALTNAVLKHAVKKITPSITKKQLERYEKFVKKRKKK